MNVAVFNAPAKLSREQCSGKHVNDLNSMERGGDK